MKTTLPSSNYPDWENPPRFTCKIDSNPGNCKKTNWHRSDIEPEDGQSCAFMIEAKGIEIVIGFYNKEAKEFESHVNDYWYDLDKIKCWQSFEFPGEEYD